MRENKRERRVSNGVFAKTKGKKIMGK